MIATKNYTVLRIATECAMAYRQGMTTRVREMRQARGWTQMDLAEHAGTRQATISKVESRPEKTELETLLKIANAFGCHVGDLVEGLPSPNDLRSLNELFLSLAIEDKTAVLNHIRALASRDDTDAATM